MDKSKLSETDICEKFISPALVQAGRDVIEQVLREVPLRHQLKALLGAALARQ